MIYFYCQSYQAFTFALKYKDVCIISSQKDIIKACEYLGVQYLKHTSFGLNDFILKKKKVYNEINRIIKKTNHGQFHFSHSQYAIYCFLLVNKIVESNRNVFFHNFEYEYPKAKLRFSLDFFKAKLIQIILNARYSPVFEIRFLLKNKTVLSLSKAIIDKAIIHSYAEGEYNRIIENVIVDFNKNNKSYKGTLFIDQGIMNDDYFVTDKNEALRSFLYQNSSIVKEHPIHTKKDYFQGFEVLPSYLPVEFFFKSFEGIVMSPYSTSLLLASKFSKIKSVALLFMIKDRLLREEIKEKYQKESNGKVIFVNSLKELQTLVRSNE